MGLMECDRFSCISLVAGMGVLSFVGSLYAAVFLTGVIGGVVLRSLTSSLFWGVTEVEFALFWGVPGGILTGLTL